MKSAYQILYLLVFSLLLSACSDGDESCHSNCEPVSWACLSVLDQYDQSMSCLYEIPAGISGYENHEECTEGQLLIHGQPGDFRINAECGHLTGYVEVSLEEGDNGTLTSRLVGSLCHSDPRNDQRPIVLDYLHREADLSEYLGYSTNVRCANWFGYQESYWTGISDISLVCASDQATCLPIDGRDYLRVRGEFGEISDGWPIHLTLEANTSLVPPGEEVTLMVTVREMKAPEQELSIPVIIQGSEGRTED